MRALIETLFDVVYLISVITIGITMIRKSNGNKEYRLFGIMAVVLGAGDAFHLVPRALALCTTGLENFTTALGIGKFITSITMTVFYIILYYVWRIRYKIQGKTNITIAIYIFAALRIILCFFPQNKWLSATAPVSYTHLSSFIISYAFCAASTDRLHSIRYSGTCFNTTCKYPNNLSASSRFLGQIT